MFNEQEVFFTCPFCAEQISFLVEVLYGEQSYIEDCEVCCQPIEIHYAVEEGEVRILDVRQSH